MRTPTPAGQAKWDALPQAEKTVIEEAHNRMLNRKPLTVGDFTCADCMIVSKCSLAYDLYNLDDECLAEK